MIDRGYYDGFGGAYLPEILIATFDELVETFQAAKISTKSWHLFLLLSRHARGLHRGFYRFLFQSRCLLGW